MNGSSSLSGDPALLAPRPGRPPGRQEAVLADLRALAEEMPREALAAFLGRLEAVRVEILLSQAPVSSSPPPEGKPDRLLSVGETAARIGMSRWWVRQNKASLPIVRLPGGRLKFSEKRLESWLGRRAR